MTAWNNFPAIPSNVDDLNDNVGLVTSNTNAGTGETRVPSIVSISQADYTALASKDPNTLYFIVG